MRLPWKRKSKFVKVSDLEVVSDLDSIVSKSVGFRFEGRIHEIKPLSVQEFIYAANALAACDDLLARSKKGERMTEDMLLDAYAGVFAVMTESIDRDCVARMTIAQVGALYSLVLECVMGKAVFHAEKKSTNEPTALA